MMIVVGMKQLMFLALIVSAAAFVYAVPAEAARAVVTQNVNVRAAANTNSPVVGRLLRGDRVNVARCASSGRWCRVQSRRTRDGWVRSRYLDRVPGSSSRRGGICFYGQRGHVCLGR
jgi:uncharacterized protein YraI